MARSVFTSLVVTAEVQAGLDGALDGLGRQGALSALIVERSGLLLASGGQPHPAGSALGALVAGIFKSLKTLAGLLGEGAVRELRQRGTGTVTAITLLDSEDVLLVTFPAESHDGRIDGLLRQAVDRIGPLLDAARSAPPPPRLSLDASSIEEALGNL